METEQEKMLRIEKEMSSIGLALTASGLDRKLSNLVMDLVREYYGI